jgi:hypothetical protein
MRRDSNTYADTKLYADIDGELYADIDGESYVDRVAYPHGYSPKYLRLYYNGLP